MEQTLETSAGNVKLIALKHLTLSERNVRRTGDLEVGDLKASIKAQGLLQNLIVCPLATKRGKATGKFEVVGGGRRLRALMALAEEGDIAPDEGILCRVLPTRQAAEASLAENFHREAMHPADEFAAFQQLVEDGMPIEEVALRFGVSPLTVRRRLKLAGLHPSLIQLYRAGGITMEQLMALTLTDDQEQQLRVWEAAPTWRRDAQFLRDALVSDEVDAATHPLALLVGLEAYEAAGGTVRRDLFSEEDAGYLQDGALLERLATERLEDAAEAVRAEGWSWVDVVVRSSGVDLFRFGRCEKSTRDMSDDEAAQQAALQAAYDEVLHEEVADDDEDAWDAHECRLDEARERLAEFKASLSVYDEAACASGGAIVCVDRKGRIEVHRGLVRPEDRKAGRAASQSDDRPADSRAADESDRQRPEYSAALMVELTAQRTLAVRAALLDEPVIALSVLLHSLVQRLLQNQYGRTASAVRLVPDAPDSGLTDKTGSGLGASKAMERLMQARDRWGDRAPGNSDRLLSWLIQMDDGDRMELLALCVALMVNDVRDTHRSSPLDAVCAALQLDMADWWEPTAQGFFSRVTKDSILSAMAEACGPEAAARAKGVSKAELARVAERDMAGKRWLPAPLRGTASSAQDGSADA